MGVRPAPPGPAAPTGAPPRPPGSAAHDLGLVLLVPAALAATAAVVAVAAGEPFALPGLALTAALSGGLGGALLAADRAGGAALLGPALTPALVAAGWLAAALLCAVPFLGVGAADGVSPTTAAFADPVNALFESMSGLTSTGLTVASDASALPRVLQWWRSVLQWVGAIGVLYIALALTAPRAGNDDHDGLSDEMSVDALPGRGARVVRDVWALYGAYTLASVGAFWAAGMPPWEALNHGMTGIATGGFTVTESSFQDYGPGVKLVAVVVMVLGSVSFVLHYLAVVRRRLGPVGRDAQVRLLAALLVAGPAALWLAVRVAEPDARAVDLVFEWTSALATCGFASVDERMWGTPALLLLAAAMFVGASSGSTVGGIKLRRVALLAAAAWRAVGLGPAAVRVDGEAVEVGEGGREAATVALAFAAALAVGTGALALVLGDTYPLASIFFEATSALGTVGLAVDVVGPDAPASARLVLTALMWLGRLEVVAVVVLVAAAVRPARASG